MLRIRLVGGVRAQRGFSLIEVVIGLFILAVGLLAYASSSLSHVRISTEETRRSAALHTTREFVERLRIPDDWSGLYASLRTLAISADETTTGATRLNDGRWARPLTDYFPDIDTPESVGDMVVLVDVPASLPEGTGTALILREDVTAPAFGLPADLNGDGTLDANARDADYVALPVVLTFQWREFDGSARELRRTTWLRGER